MQAHRLGHGRTEGRQEVLGADLFVPVVDPAQRRLFPFLVQQVADIVQKRRGDEGRRRIRPRFGRRLLRL